MHLSKKELPNTTKPSNKTSTPSRSSPQIPDYEPQFIDPHYKQHPYWNDDLYDQDKLENKHN